MSEPGSGRTRRGQPTRSHCSHCGTEVPQGALACPECGSDRETGWADEETLGRAAFPDFDEDDYRDAIAGLPGAPARSPRGALLGAIALIALLAFLLAYVL